MPQLISKIIQYRVMLNNTAFSKGVFDLDEPVYYQYAVGEVLPGLRHDDAKFNSDEVDAQMTPLFNKVNHTKISDQIGQYGLLHIQLEPKKYLKEIFVEPDGVTVDIIIGSNGMLIYEFYNPTKADTITIRATLDDDAEGIADKIRAASDDLEMRQYYIRQSLRKPGLNKIDKPKTEFGDWLTAKELAKFRGESISTVYNKTSSKEYKTYPGRGKKKYKKSDFENIL